MVCILYKYVPYTNLKSKAAAPFTCKQHLHGLTTLKSIKKKEAFLYFWLPSHATSYTEGIGF